MGVSGVKSKVESKADLDQISQSVHWDIQVFSTENRFPFWSALFSLLASGVGGNLVSVQASRISTYLHMAHVIPGKVPPGYTYCHTPCTVFCSRTGVNARTARLLLLMVVPGHLVFLFLISFVHVGSTSITLRFAVVFLVMALLQVAFLLYLSDVLAHFVWKRALGEDFFGYASLFHSLF